MRIKSLDLRNVRLFNGNVPQIIFSEEKNVTIFLGDNGTGKTTILSTIASMLSAFTSAFPGIGGLRMFKGTDIHITNRERMEDYLRVAMQINYVDNSSSPSGCTINVSRTLKGLSQPAEESNVKDLKNYAESLKERILSGGDVELPIVAYYNTERGNITAPERKRDFATSFERWDCYKDALSSHANFKRFFMWFDLMTTEEYHKIKERKDFEYQLPVLRAVRSALTSMMGERYSNPRIELKPLRFVMDEQIKDGSVRQLRIEQMSDGFRIMTAMVADIASRMAEANPQMENPLATHGVVLIDELDLHLHPHWQRQVLNQLHTVFPNVQFIVSTHSPLVVIGIDSDAQVFKLNNAIIEEENMLSYSNYDASLMLLSDLFGLSSARNPKYDSKIQRRNELSQKVVLTEDENTELESLDAQLIDLPFGASKLDLDLRKAIDTLIKKLK